LRSGSRTENENLERGGTQMIPRSKGTIVLITVALLVLALTTMLPTAASASPLIASDPPWRGNGLASGFVYGHSYNTDSQVYQWQQVHTYLYERIAWWWYKCSSASNVEEWTSYCFACASVSEVYNQFYVKGFHEWNIDGNSYDCKWTTGPKAWC
jgi:hypothetical protein